MLCNGGTPVSQNTELLSARGLKITPGFASNRIYQSGITLLEIMIASALSGVVLVGVLTLFVNSHHNNYLHNQIRQIQENGRFALEILGEDLRMTKYLGLNIRPDTIETSGVDGATAPCEGAGWAAKLEKPLFAANNYNPYSNSCIDNSNYVEGTDVLVVRRAESAPIPTSAIKSGGLYLYTSFFSGRVFEAANDEQINTDVLSATSGNPSHVYSLSENTYFIRRCSDMSVGNKSVCGLGDDSLPTLVRVTLSGSQPLVENVENFQLMFGIDTDLDEAVDQIVNASEVVNWANVVAVRVYILIRSGAPIHGYSDTGSYVLGDVTFKPAGEEVKFYRKVFSQTFALRNPTRYAPV